MSMTIKIIHVGFAKYLEDSVSDSMREQAMTRGASGYYTHEGNPPGVWLGSGLGMINKNEGDIIGKDELYTFLEKMEDPVTHEKLAPHITMSLGDPRKPNSRSTVTGFDATFAAPKSFSILWILAKEEERTQLDQVWQTALKEAIAEFEKEAAVGRIGHGGTGRVKLTGFTIAAYDHYTNRAGEPHYHTHAVISNLAQREDGRIVALDGRTLLAVSERINILHSQRLRDNLTKRYGMQWEKRPSMSNPNKKVWELAGISDELIKASYFNSNHIPSEDIDFMDSDFGNQDYIDECEIDITYPQRSLYRLESIGFVAGEYRPCWKCKQPIREFAIGVHVLPEQNHYEDLWVLLPVAHFDRAGLLTPQFKAFLKRWYCIDYRNSKAMNQRYLALTCNRCGVLQGDNFIFNDFNGQGGNFIHPQYPSQSVHWLDLPAITDQGYREYHFLFPQLSVTIPAERISKEGRLILPPGMSAWTRNLN